MYTVEIYKADRRKKSGERLVNKEDIDVTYSDAQGIAGALELQGYRVEIHETWITKKNILNGQEFQERYDTPYYCSPSSETYWSM